MDFFRLFGGEGDGSDQPHRAAQTAWDSVERKVDRLIRELNIPEPDVADGLPQRVNDLVARGNKIEAIKVYREMTGLGLKEAKDAIDGNAVLSPIGRLERKLDAVLDALGIHDFTPERMTPPSDEDILRLIRNGQKLEAIALHRQRHHSSLLDAKNAVETMERELRGR